MTVPWPTSRTWIAVLASCLCGAAALGCSADPSDDTAVAVSLADQDTSSGLADASGAADTGVQFGDVTSLDALDSGPIAAIDTHAIDAGAKLGAPYPIVLAHGFFGFDDFAGSGFIKYFFGVQKALADAGEKLVFTPAVDPFNSSDERGKQLIAAIEKVLAQTGHAKVNIIGHSQGGLDARVAAYLRPDIVASVTTYATPNKGTPVADWVMKLLTNDNLQKLLDAMAKLVGGPLYDKAGEASSIVAGIKTFTQPGIKAFNESYPNRDSVKYFSVTGRTDNHVGGLPCIPDVKLDFITKFSLVLDPVDPLFAIQEAMLDGGLGAPFPNDGMVRVKDARHGVFLGCVPADHMDQVGHLLGDKPGLFNTWDHRNFFVDLVGWLRTGGL